MQQQLALENPGSLLDDQDMHTEVAHSFFGVTDTFVI